MYLISLITYENFNVAVFETAPITSRVNVLTAKPCILSHTLYILLRC